MVMIEMVCEWFDACVGQLHPFDMGASGDQVRVDRGRSRVSEDQAAGLVDRHDRAAGCFDRSDHDLVHGRAAGRLDGDVAALRHGAEHRTRDRPAQPGGRT